MNFIKSSTSKIRCLYIESFEIISNGMNKLLAISESFKFVSVCCEFTKAIA